jgi:hypothetical protein
MELALHVRSRRQKVHEIADGLAPNGLDITHADPSSRLVLVTSGVHCAHTLQRANK